MTGARVREEALSFACRGERLVGVVSLPALQTSELALVVVVGGPQVRTGSHRQFTQLCRSVAAAGMPALRFDVRGMGDSSGALQAFEAIGDDIGAALDALQTRLPGVRRVVLWGLCDGSSAILIYLHERNDARVAGLVLLNPWVRSAQTLARTHVKHYYWNRLRQPDFWRKLLLGGVALKALRDLLGNLRAASLSATASDTGTVLPFQERMRRGADGFAGPVLWVLSGQDLTAREFNEHIASDPRWQALMLRGSQRRFDIPDADHTFSTPSDAEIVAATTVDWLQSRFEVKARRS